MLPPRADNSEQDARHVLHVTRGEGELHAAAVEAVHSVNKEAGSHDSERARQQWSRVMCAQLILCRRSAVSEQQEV